MMSEDATASTSTNPFYNEKAANIKKNLDSMSMALKDWQADFKKKYNRRPTLDDMKRDPAVSNLLGSMKNERNLLKTTIQKFVIE